MMDDTECGSSNGRYGKTKVRPTAFQVLEAFHRQWVDARFVRSTSMVPTRGSLLFGRLSHAQVQLVKRFRSSFQDILFSQYRWRLERHYGPEGRGYSSLGVTDDLARQERYEIQGSRLGYFVGKFSEFMDVQDGDTFLDLGCGTGQNIRWLARSFPKSKIVGFDLNDDALQVIRDFEPSLNVSLEQWDLRRDETMLRIEELKPDHIVMSHVFSLLYDESANRSRVWRESFLNGVIARSRKSVVVIDTFAVRGQIQITAEQRDRAVVRDDILGYLTNRDDGFAVLTYSPATEAVLFCKRPLS